MSVSGTQTFSIVSGDMKFAVIPILDVSLKFRAQSKLPGQKENIVVLLQADARVSYPVEIGLVKNGNKVCSASYKMFNNLELLSVSSPIIGYHRRIDAKSDNYRLHEANLNLCTLNPICQDTCKYAKDNVCDDGGPGSQYVDCQFGTDCTDCGARSSGASYLNYNCKFLLRVF